MDDHEAGPRTTTRDAPAGTVSFDEDLVIEVVSPAQPTRRVELTSTPLFVGKQADCLVTLDDPEVSRKHLELRRDPHGVLVRDLGSKNGSYYRGARLTEVLLGAGAVVVVGNTQLRICRKEAGESVVAVDETQEGRLLGRSLVMRRLFAQIRRVAATDTSVLIEGETGSGKDLCAEALYRASLRSDKPYVVCDLSGITRSLIESELFGHVKGAFTGAITNRVGAFDEAHTGTLFLDEIGELELGLQPRMLRAVENRSVRPVGSAKYHEVDVRLIAATNRELSREVIEGRFREDLFHRISVVRLRIPPLRERREDIPLLVAAMLEGSGVTASAEATELLIDHDWPGNVRELRNVVERALALRGASTVLDADLLATSSMVDSRPAPSAKKDYHGAKQALIETWERDYVERALKATRYRMSEAARRCGLGRAHLYRLVRKYGIETE